MNAPEKRAKLLNDLDANLSLAQATTDELQRHMRPGLADAVLEMMRSDIDSAERRVAWLRERLEPEDRGAA